MLLRWLVNQYLRDAAEGKVRELVGEMVQPKAKRQAGKAAAEVQSTASEGQTRSEHPHPGPLPEGERGSRPGPAKPGPEPAAGDSEFLPCDVAFIFALGIESGGLVDRLTGAERSKLKHGVEHAGKLAGREVVVVEAGVGAKAAARAAAEAIKFYQPRWVVSAGFAGALTEDLRRGHIVMPEEVASSSGERLSVGLKLSAEQVAATRGLHVGRLLTVSDIVRQPAERRRLAEEHGAIACDMETFGVAQACREHGVRMLSVRVISDAVDDELPPEVANLLAQKSLAGKIGAAAGAVMGRPSAAMDLWKLREDALKASDRLAKFLVGVVEQLT